jgi:hypothetical protein
MTLRLWLAFDHHAAFRCGGWAWVRADGAELCGQAGGARNVTPGRNRLEGLAAALKDLPPGDLTLHLADAAFARAIAALPDLAAAGWRDARGEPLADQDLWLAVAAILSRRPYAARHAEPAPKTPAAFAAAWAELARDKAKAQGAFAAAIPRPNLAKIQGL